MMAAATSHREDTPLIPAMSSRLVAEILGTFLLVFGGVGTALLAAGFGTSDSGTSLGVG